MPPRAAARLLALAALAACAPNPPAEAAPPSAERIPPRQSGTYVGVVDRDGPMHPELRRAIIAADSATRAGAARVARIEVRPDTLVLVVGELYDALDLRIAYLDSAGEEIRNIVPNDNLHGAPCGCTLEAVHPSTARLTVRPMTSTGLPRRDVPVGGVRIHVVSPAPGRPAR